MIDPSLFIWAQTAQEQRVKLATRECVPMAVCVGPDGMATIHCPPSPEMRRWTRVADAWMEVCAALAAADLSRVTETQERMRQVCTEVAENGAKETTS